MTAIQLPYRRKDAQRVGARLFKKQVLKIGQIDYQGRTLDFTRDYLEELARNFTGKAYDQVPFVLADGENRHTMDPERFRGEVKGVEVTDDGLHALIELTDEGARVVEQNPRLAVSARIVEDHPKGRALQHVLGTLDPRATGMKPWEAIELSSGSPPVIDLTAATFRGEADLSQYADSLEREVAHRIATSDRWPT